MLLECIAQENLKLAFFLCHHRWRCAFNWKRMGVWDVTLHLLTDQMMFEDNYVDQDVLHEVNMADMVGKMEQITEYLRLCHGP